MVIRRWLGASALLFLIGAVVEGQQPASSFMTGVQPGNLNFTKVDGASRLQRNTSAITQTPGFFGRLFGSWSGTNILQRSGPATSNIPAPPSNKLKMLSPVLPKNSN